MAELTSRHSAHLSASLLWLCLACAAPSSDVANPVGTIAFTHVTLIDATGAPPQPDMTVVVADGRIAALGKTAATTIPKRAQVVDAAGKFLIPGLWDMHVHTQLASDLSLPVFVANGITDVRDMGADLDFVLSMRERIRSGALLGPRMVVAGPILDDAPDDWPLRFKILNEEDGRAAVQRLKKRGVNLIKVHNRLSRAAYFGIIDEAKKLRLPIAGHVPLNVTLAEAVESGQKSIEHLNEFRVVAACFQKESCKSMLDLFKQHGTWHTPTLVTLRAVAHHDDRVLHRDPRLKYAPPALTEFWSDMEERFLEDQSDMQGARRKRYYTKAFEVVGEMNRQAVGLLAGTDVGFPRILPGFSLHDELELLVTAGLEPMAALQTATRNPALYFGQLDRFGTIEKGKIADLVLLAANPLDDIRNTQRIETVVMGGRLFDRDALDEILAEAARAARKQ